MDAAQSNFYANSHDISLEESNSFLGQFGFNTNASNFNGNSPSYTALDQNIESDQYYELDTYIQIT